MTLAEVVTAADQHNEQMAPLVDGLSGATDDVVAQQLIDWLQSTNRELQRLLDHLAEVLAPAARRRTMTLMRVASFERIFRDAAGIDVDKDDLKPPASFEAVHVCAGALKREARPLLRLGEPSSVRSSRAPV